MAIAQSCLAQIVAQASFLSERLNNGLFNVDTAQVSEQQASDELLDRWCFVVAQGNWEKYLKRLQWDGLDIETVRSALSTLPVVASPMPTWAITLTEIIQAASLEDANVQNPAKIPLDPENPLPFEDVLLPAVLVARHKLLTRSTSLPLELLSETAYLSLEGSLLQKLANLCGKTLEFEFSHSRPLGHSLLSLLIGDTQGSASKVHYSAFVQKLLQDGLLTFFQKYPVLGRLIATAIDFWVEATGEFLQRLKADLSEIQQVFNHPSQQELEPNTQLMKVVESAPSLSDPHNKNRSVIALTFESGLKLVYKPKDLGLEVAYNQLLDWCNQHGVPLPFKVLKVLNRRNYGWVEYVEQQPCEDEAAAQRFYQRAGMLLCLLYALGGTDCHYENLIASGEHLVLVDMETLMHHEANPMEDSAETDRVNQQFWDSVLRTGLLPRWDFSQDNRTAYDISGLGSIDPQQAPRRALRWKSINKDDMHLASEPITVPLKKNVPILNKVPLSPNDYLDELVVGFGQMYQFLIEQREALLGDDSPLKAFQGQRVRFVFRATQVYRVVLQKSLAPEFLRNGADWSVELDILSRAFLTTQDKPNAWPICGSELKAMQQLDVPYFAASSSTDALTSDVMSPIEQYFKEPSYSQAISRLQKLNQADLAQQVAIIQGAFYARVARTPGSEQASYTEGATLKENDVLQPSPLTSEQLLSHASQIAQKIRQTAIRGSDGSANWINLGYVPNAERFQLMPLGESLYDGNCGIALFLAALDYVRGSTEFRDLALGAIHSIGRFLQTADSSQRFARTIGMGAATGLGSIIYSIVRISQFLESAALLEDAQRVANLITPELIAGDRDLDIIKGAAGAILGLLALYSETGEPAVLDKAVACGQHLLEHQISVDGATRAWKTVAPKPLTGFSHGAAGIAYALVRLYAVTQDRAYKDAACEGIAYERSVFLDTAANWPDFRFFDEQNGQATSQVSWCHGAPGIGLARLGGLSILETDEIRQDVEVALQTTQEYSWQGIDHICCGNFGRIEVLLVAATKLQRPQLLETAQQRTAWVIARAEQSGFQLFPNLPSQMFSPSFFQGTAGIGYELLRLAYPEVLPSVLLWE